MPALRLALPCCAVLVACASKPPDPPPATWRPGVVFQTAREVNGRGFLDRKGLIHTHSVNSHDACDGEPRVDGGINEPCFGDFRRDLCRAKHDFVFLTDHPDLFASVDFPDTLLYRADRGDQLVTHEAGPAANWAACPDAPPALILAGAETDGLLPVGLEAHVPGRAAIYNSNTPSSLDEVKAHGAVALVAHTEGWTAERLAALPLDGFEMFNLHRSSLKNAGIAAELILNKVDKGDFDGLPEPDAFFTAFALDDDAYWSTWGTTLARGAKRVTTMGTDCHRNTFPQLLQDGERIDSYRRMMIAFSNHLLVKPKPDGTWDDRDLKDALRARRLYGAFDFLGTPEGFDFVARVGGAVHEMGEEVSLAAGVTLELSRPTVKDLDPAAEAPLVRLRILKAREGGWDTVAESTDGPVTFTASEPGAYRAEARITPRHLRSFIGRRGDFIKAERPWVYSNAIFVTP
ncbi:MAG: hypothetical protein AMXMBFR34_53800 [Myxococcaceae bacterium]